MRTRPPTSWAGWVALFAVLLVASLVTLKVEVPANGFTSALAVLWLFALVFFVQWIMAGPRS